MSNEEQEKQTTQKHDILSFMLSLGVIVSLLMSSYALTKSLLLAKDLSPVIKAVQRENMVISKDYDKGQSFDKAKETQKPILVIVYADWCGVSKAVVPQFDDLTKSKEITDNFAIAYINGDLEENEDYMKKFNIVGYPTIFVLNGEDRKDVSNDMFFDDSYSRDKAVEEILKLK